MKKTLIIFLCATFAFACTSSDVVYYKPTSDPKDFILQLRFFVEHPVYASQAEQNKHKKEILNTFMVNEVVELGNVRAIFYSYSIGADIVRDVEWGAVVDGNLYMVFAPLRYDLEDFSITYDIDKEELNNVIVKQERWKQKPLRRWNN